MFVLCSHNLVVPYGNSHGSTSSLDLVGYGGLARITWGSPLPFLHVTVHQTKDFGCQCLASLNLYRNKYVYLFHTVWVAFAGAFNPLTQSGFILYIIFAIFQYIYLRFRNDRLLLSSFIIIHLLIVLLVVW